MESISEIVQASRSRQFLSDYRDQGRWSARFASLRLLVGIDHFMSIGRATTNFIGNAVVTIAINRWEGELSVEELRGRLAAGGES